MADARFSIGLLLSLLFIAVACIIVIKIYNKKMSASKAGYITADRKLGQWEAALSIAASWIWAPALFISAQKSYQDGILGLLWFLVPNILCLFLFAFFAEKVRAELPEGFTLSDYIRKKTSNRVQSLYWVSLIGLAICAFAVQLLAGGQLLYKFTGIPFFLSTIILCLIPLSYSFFSGLKGSVVTDVLKMIFIYGIGMVIVPWVVISGGGLGSVGVGIGGKIQTTNFFGAESLRIFLTFGLPTTLGLLAGPFGDQTFWQRTFAIQKNHVKSAFIKAALLFAVVPIMMSFLGFVAAGNKLIVADPQIVNLETVSHYLPAFGTGLFVFMIFSALISILDTKLTAISSLGGHDFINRYSKSESASYIKVIKSARLSMVFLVVSAIIIANIPGLKIIHLFLFYGTLRSATVIPTILLILKKPLAEKGVFVGILFSLIVGLPIFAYGNIHQNPTFIVLGALLTVSSSGFIAYFWPKKTQ